MVFFSLPNSSAFESGAECVRLCMSCPRQQKHCHSPYRCGASVSHAQKSFSAKEGGIKRKECRHVQSHSALSAFDLSGAPDDLMGDAISGTLIRAQAPKHPSLGRAPYIADRLTKIALSHNASQCDPANGSAQKVACVYVHRALYAQR